MPVSLTENTQSPKQRKPRKKPAKPRVRLLKEVADNDGFAYSSLREAHMRGEFCVIKVGRSWYVEVDEFERWIASRRETAERA